MNDAPRRRPNVLFITCDQWRGDCLSAVGHPVVRTPNADALAAEGVMFTRHYAGAAPCSPARACIYTGLYQMNNRVCRNGTPLDRRHDNLALAARRVGYEPTLFGYTDTSPDPRWHAPDDPVLRTYEGVLPGFGVRQLLPEHQKPWLSWLAQRGVQSSAGFPDIHRPANFTGKVSRNPPVYDRDQTPAAFLAGEFLRWLGEQDAGQPWFAHISFLSPHPPYVVPEPFNTMFSGAGGFARAASAKREARLHPYVEFELRKQKLSKFLPAMKGKVRDLSAQDFETIRGLYHGMIAEVDSQLGRIWAGLKHASQWDDTIIVLTSDHGEMMGDHHMLGKGGFFDQSYRLPLIVRQPGSRKGRKADVFTEAVDIAPTIVDLIGGEVPAHWDGASLAPFLAGKRPAAWRDAAHWEFDFRDIAAGPANQPFGLPPQRCNLAVLRTERHKYVHFAGLPSLLFDLQEDPHELINLADDPSRAGLRAEMAERMLTWRAEHLDQSLALSELTEDGVRGSFATRIR